MEDFFYYFTLIGVGFVVGFINTLAGGGSLLTLPVLIFLGLPPVVANGTNRIVILTQALVGTAGYKSKGISSYPFSLYLGISASVGALIGAQIAVDIKGETFNRILAIVLVVVGLLTIVKNKNTVQAIEERVTGKYLLLSIIVFFFIGIYGGFINAGIGFVIMIFLNGFNRISLIKTNATKVALIAVYTSLALALFAYNGKVDWIVGLWMSLGTAIGAWWSSRWSVKKGDRVIRIMMLIMVIAISIKLWFFD